MSTLGKSTYGTMKDRNGEFFAELIWKLVFKCRCQKVVVMAVGQREQKFYSQGSKKCPEEGRRHALGSRISWLCHHHLHLGWLVYFEMCRIKKKDKMNKTIHHKPKRKTSSLGLNDPRTSAYILTLYFFFSTLKCS